MWAPNASLSFVQTPTSAVARLLHPVALHLLWQNGSQGRAHGTAAIGPHPLQEDPPRLQETHPFEETLKPVQAKYSDSSHTNSSIPETSKSGQSSCVLVLLWTPLMAGTKSNQLWSTFGHRSAPRIFALLDGFAAHVGQLLVHFVPPCFLMKGLLPQQSRIKSHKILSADHGKTMPRVRPFVRLKPIELEWYRHIAGNVRQMKRYNLSALDQGRCQGW